MIDRSDKSEMAEHNTIENSLPQEVQMELLKQFLETGNNGKPFSPRMQQDYGRAIKQFMAFGFKVPQTKQDLIVSSYSKIPAGVENINGRLVYKVDPLDYECTPFEKKYIDMFGIKSRLDAHWKSGQPYLIEGEQGTGKTQVVREWCFENKIPLVTLLCNEGTKLSDIIGHPELDGDYTPYQLGALPRAIDVANQTGKCVLYIDELGLLTAPIQGSLNEALDNRRSVTIARLGLTYEVAKDAKLLIVASTNPVTYGGRNPLNADLNARFHVKVMPQLSADKYMQIVNTEGLDKEVVQALESTTMQLISAGKSNEVEYKFSPRDLDNIINQYKVDMQIYKENGDINSTSFNIMCQTILAKYRAEPESNINTVKNILRSCCNWSSIK